MRYSGLPADFPAPVDGEITLCDDGGFELRADNSADYLRQTFTDGVLTLTNQSEPAPVEPVDPEPSELEQLRADVDYIAIMTGVEL